MAQSKHVDVLIIGGAAVGSSVAYFLMANPDFTGRVMIVERDPKFTQASTSLSAASIRQQYSNPINVKISLYGIEFMRRFAEHLSVDGDTPNVDFHESGYLFLATNDAQVQVLRENHDVQIGEGADVSLLSQSELKSAFPHLNVEDVLLASYGNKNEGWYSNTAIMNGFRAKARSLGAEYRIAEVVSLHQNNGKVDSVTLSDGETLSVGTVVNAAGPRASLIAGMLGLPLPVEPRKRTLFIFDCQNSPQGSAKVNNGNLPLLINHDGVFCRPEGKNFLCGKSPDPDPAVDVDDFEPRHDEFEDIWISLASRSPAFEAIKLVGYWAGHYAYNTLDQNAIIGPHPEISNFIFANGFSGHGLQQSPAVGRGVSEWITYQEYRSLDLADLGYERILSGTPFLEKGVI